MTPSIRDAVTVLDHPLVATKLSVIRDTRTETEAFRRNVQELSILLLVEASRSWATSPIQVQTPLKICDGAVLAKPVVFVPILRAGTGMLDGMLRIVPDAQVGHLGLYRDEKTLRPVSYYRRLPPNVADAEVLLLDPMLATGHSACEAVTVLKTHGARSIQFVCIVACPQGVEQIRTSHPDVPVIAAVVDPGLNDVGYIVPGLGDAGDRYFGTS
jgi:uracil phosphoribosyltransferase